MNRVDRLLALVLHLQSRRVTTAEQLAEYFGLSVRTIYRDLTALGEAGVPIVAEAGVGYSLLRGYHLPPVNFTAEEAYALVTGGMLVEQLADASVKDQMHSALLKLRAILPHDQQERVARLEGGLATLATGEAPPQADLSMLQRALADRRLLQFHYRGAGKAEMTVRTVEPLGLIRYLERWHLIAWCRSCGDYRDFRTDRMSNVTMRGETFAARTDFSLAKYIRTMPEPKLRARVRFAALAADRAKREWWLGVLDEEQTAAGHILTLAAVDWEPLVGWLLSFGEQAVVIAPVSLRKLLINAAERAALHHAKNLSEVS